MNQPYTFDRLVRLLIGIGTVLFLIWLLDYLSTVLIPFAVALLLAYLLDPMVSFFERKIKSRSAAIFLSLFIVTASLGGLTLILIPLVGYEIQHMSRLIQQFISDKGLKERLAEYFPDDLNAYLRELLSAEELQAFFQNNELMSVFTKAAQNILPELWGVFSGSINVVMGLLGLTIILLYVVFILIDYRRISEAWTDYLPEQYRGPVKRILGDLTQAMNSYFRAQALVAGIVGVLFALGFWLIGLPLGIGLGLFIGLLNMVPYLQTLGIVPAFFLALMYSLENNESFWVIAGLVLLVFVVVQAIQEAILVPKIMGDVTGLNPAVILLSLSIWGKVLGLLGLLIAIPMTYLLVSYYKRFIDGKSITKKTGLME